MSDFADIKNVTTEALRLFRHYYSLLDGTPQTRVELQQLYVNPPTGEAGPELLMEWNGHRAHSTQEVAAFFASLPKTKHEVKCADTHPLPAGAVMIIVHGEVVYDDEHKRLFFQRLILRRSNLDGTGPWLIVQDYVRWTGESN
jgi:NTF2-related export protein 1/2